MTLRLSRSVLFSNNSFLQIYRHDFSHLFCPSMFKKKAFSKHDSIIYTCLLLLTDINHVEPRTQSNRFTTSTTFSDCSKTKQGNMIHIVRLLIQLYIHFFTQTLITLNLSSNQIEEKGAQHLADALRNNTVILILSSFISHSGLPFWHRHSSH
jgi:hypothetical protein